MFSGKVAFSALTAIASAAVAAAVQPVWGQCGGIGWSGDTTCVSGAVCTKLNDYYFQCLPGPTAPATTTTPATSAPASTTTSTGGPIPTGAANFWFSFGDSYTQTGFDITGTLPSIGNPLGNPPYPGFTAVGGVNWIDLDTVVYNKSLLLTYNFAYGGATIDASLVQPYDPSVKSLTDQVNQFLSAIQSGTINSNNAPWTSKNALFSFWIGINDIGNSWYQSGDRDAFSDTLLNAYFALVQKIYAVGGRNFLFINVPPVDRSPLMLQQSASDQAAEKAVINGFNTKLAAKVASFKANNTGVQTWLWDSNAEFTKILNDPKSYGFVDAVSFGGTGDFWGNNYHPSAAAHDIFANQIGQLLGNTVW
ncbi:hypothetical protein K474DRAFT_1664941 [Panus rudis PR-1116 ss-1]|nr:hypothetical protein K474DRAFT_1664941 [Panus rudis PR-1116 ss-1]